MRPGDAACAACYAGPVQWALDSLPCSECGCGTTRRVEVPPGSPLCLACELHYTHDDRVALATRSATRHYTGDNTTTRIVGANTRGPCVRCGDITVFWTPGVPRLELATSGATIAAVVSGTGGAGGTEAPRVEVMVTLAACPPYGDRGTLQAPDGSGWRLVSCTPRNMPGPPGGASVSALECVWVRD